MSIGVFSSEDLPRLAISLVVGVILLAAAVSAIAHFYPRGGEMAGFLMAAALLAVFWFSQWIGRVIWERMRTNG